MDFHSCLLEVSENICIAPCKETLRNPDSRYWIPDSLYVELKKIVIVNGILDFLSRIMDSKAKDFGLHKQNCPGFLFTLHGVKMQ